jgi:hypothetical protein
LTLPNISAASFCRSWFCFRSCTARPVGQPAARLRCTSTQNADVAPGTHLRTDGGNGDADSHRAFLSLECERSFLLFSFGVGSARGRADRVPLERELAVDFLQRGQFRLLCAHSSLGHGRTVSDRLGQARTGSPKATQLPQSCSPWRPRERALPMIGHALSELSCGADLRRQAEQLQRRALLAT